MATSATAEPETDEVQDDLESDDTGVDIPSHATRLEWFESWYDEQHGNRSEAFLDRDYYDGNQLTEKELKILKQRKQPPTINNRIAKKINTLLGEEIERRFDPVGKPRNPEGTEDARVVTDALRYIADEQEFDRVKSAVTGDFLIEGIGVAVKRMTEAGKHELLHVRYDRFGYDPLSRTTLFKDALFTFVMTDMELFEAEAMFPGSKILIEGHFDSLGIASGNQDNIWFSRDRKRTMVVEMYFQAGNDCYVSFFNKAGDLRDPEKTAILDDDGKYTVNPLQAVSCYIAKNGDRYGVVRNLRSPQDAINKRESKALHLLNSQNVIAEKDTIPDIEEFKDNLAQPDGISEVAVGALSGPDGKRFTIERHLDLATGHVQLLQEAKQNIDGIGPSASNMPDMPANATGRAFQMRKKASALDYGTIFDHLSWWSKGIFELDWLCAKWGWTKEKWLRVTDDQMQTGYRFVGLNRNVKRADRFQELISSQPPVPPDKALQTAAGDAAPAITYGVQMQMQAMTQQLQAAGQKIEPQQQQQMFVQAVLKHPLMQDVITVNQVAKMVVDVIIDEAPDTSVLAEEQFATLSELMGIIVNARPDMAPKVARMLIQSSTLPDKRELLDDWDKGPDPQVAQLQQQNQQLQQKMAMLEAQLVAAEVQKTQSEAQLNAAKTQEIMKGAGAGAPEQLKPHEILAAQREQQGAQLDVAKADAQIQKDQALTNKHHVDTQINVAKARQSLAQPRAVPR